MCLGGRCSAGRKGEQGGAIQLQDNYAQDPGYQKRRKMLQARGGRPQVFLRQTLQGARVGVTLGHSLNGHRHCVLSVLQFPTRTGTAEGGRANNKADFDRDTAAVRADFVRDARASFDRDIAAARTAARAWAAHLQCADEKLARLAHRFGLD